MTERANSGEDLHRRAVEALRQLQRDGRLTNRALAKRVFASESAASRERRELESRGVIRGYMAVVDEEKVGYAVSVFVVVSLGSQRHSAKEAFEQAIERIDQVMECHSIAGEHDYLLRVIARDMHDYERVLGAIEDVAETDHVQSFVVLHENFRKREVPL